MIQEKRKESGADCTDKQTDEETFHCLQTEATDDIQRILKSIEETLQKQDGRLDDGDKRFQEIRDFIVKKETANGYIEKEIDHTKQDILQGHDNRLAIETRVSTLEACYTNLKDSNQTIINLLKLIGVGLFIAVITFMLAILGHIIQI